MDWKDVATIGAPVVGLIYVGLYKRYVEGHEKEIINNIAARRVHLMSPETYDSFTRHRCLYSKDPIYPA